MRDWAAPDELDLALVATLQAAPRADWQRVGHVLGVAGSTAARRWARLTQSGLAGHVMDFDGRHIRYVPITPWPEAEADRAEAAMLSRVRRLPWPPGR